MKLRLFPILAAILFVTGTLNAQTVTIPFNVGTGYNCGRVSSPFYCWGIPTTEGSPAATVWIDTYLTGYNAGTGFVAFPTYPMMDLKQGTVTGNSFTTTKFCGGGQCPSFPTSVTIKFNGTTTEGGTYTAVINSTYTYYYSSGGGGRGGAGAGWRFICTGGSMTVTYQ